MTPYGSRYTMAFEITPSAVSPIENPLGASNQFGTGCSGFIATADDVIDIQTKEGNQTVSFPVIAGVTYDLALRFLFSVQGSATVIGLL